MSTTWASKIVAEPVADDVVESLDLELAGERLLDTVDDRQLGVALPGLLDRAGAGEGCADVLPDKGEQPLVALRVADVLRVRLHDQDARSFGPRP